MVLSILLYTKCSAATAILPISLDKYNMVYYCYYFYLLLFYIIVLLFIDMIIITIIIFTYLLTYFTTTTTNNNNNVIIIIYVHNFISNSFSLSFGVSLLASLASPPTRRCPGTCRAIGFPTCPTTATATAASPGTAWRNATASAACRRHSTNRR